MGADKTGAPAPYVERGELDQEQHDAVRDVFYVPGAATLVRADLFAALGGFDPGIELLGEDLDLSLAGPRGRRPGAGGARRPGSPTSRPWASVDRSTTAAASRCATGCAPAGSATRWSTRRAGAAPGRGDGAGRVASTASSPAASATPATSLRAWTWNVRHRRGIRRPGAGCWPSIAAVPDRDVRRPAGARQRPAGRPSCAAQPGEPRATTGWATVTASGPGPGHQPALGPGPVVAGRLGGGAGPAGRSAAASCSPAASRRSASSPPSRAIRPPWCSSGSAASAAPGLGSDTAGAHAARPCSAVWATCSSAPWACCAPCSSSAPCPLGALGIWRLARPLGSRRARITALVVYACLPARPQRRGPRSLGRSGHLRPHAVDGQPAGSRARAWRRSVRWAATSAPGWPTDRCCSASCCWVWSPRWPPGGARSPWSSCWSLARGLRARRAAGRRGPRRRCAWSAWPWPVRLVAAAAAAARGA